MSVEATKAWGGGMQRIGGGLGLQTTARLWGTPSGSRGCWGGHRDLPAGDPLPSPSERTRFDRSPAASCLPPGL